MKVARARADVAPTVAALDQWIATQGLRAEWGGSWRRGTATVGDLDLVLYDIDLHDVVWPAGFEIVRCGPKVGQGIYHGVQVDVWACPTAARPCFMWFVTGPVELNVAMRATAKRHGYKLSQTGLDGYGGPLVDESDVARALGLPDLTPAERDRWRHHYRKQPAAV